MDTLVLILDFKVHLVLQLSVSDAYVLKIKTSYLTVRRLWVQFSDLRSFLMEFAYSFCACVGF